MELNRIISSRPKLKKEKKKKIKHRPTESSANIELLYQGRYSVYTIF